ncbi:protein-disulfide reductase DsbD [Pokkaliibacter sp. MBI-7]|uniref:protein-disulfide reductase DsbD n=1 Tax=Pokkaliibacter sp. MBI-7 TaxID=3040600 RepID=UPI00244B95CC|nr:protein-disulfide reductase DsbD [Pokkaliibacter sp. MBI-7]MDH2435184.1 protein-disulfide reductase DsbD [Pokkaliibacter sp. MBI-7]
MLRIVFACLLGILISPAYAGLFDKSSNTEPLPVDQAFVMSVDHNAKGEVALSWYISPSYYLYKDKIKVEVSGSQVESLMLPDPGEEKPDPLFGKVVVYHQQAHAQISLARDESAAAADTLTVTYQGCWEGGICFPPVQQQLKVTDIPVRTSDSINTPVLPAGSVESSKLSGPAESVQGQGVTAPPEGEQISASSAGSWFLAGQADFLQLLKQQSSWVIVLAFFIAGLGLSFTPCVFPMIPILSSMIAGQQGMMSSRRAFFLSLTYVLAMGVTYTIAGVIAGLFGANLQAQLQAPWILILLALFFVTFALAMFGVFTLQLPSALQSHISVAANRKNGSGWLGIAMMGMLSALIVGPCVAAPLAGALIFIGQQGSAGLGAAALFAMSLGMGVPLLIVGTSAGHILPRAGAWMESVKHVFGVLMLLMALWLLERVLPLGLVLALLAIVLLLAAVVLGALQPLDNNAGAGRRLGKGIALLVLLYSVVLLVGLAGGSRNPLAPLAVYAESSHEGNVSTELNFHTVTTWAELQQQLAQAKEQGRPVMMDFYADWCISCKELDAFTFKDAAVMQELKSFHLIRVDLTANTADHQRMYKFYELVGPPALVFYSSQGDLMRSMSWSGVLSAEQLLRHLSRMPI